MFIATSGMLEALEEISNSGDLLLASLLSTFKARDELVPKIFGSLMFGTQPKPNGLLLIFTDKRQNKEKLLVVSLLPTLQLQGHQARTPRRSGL